MVFWRGIELAGWRLVALGGEQFVSGADLYVVSFARKYFERIVLCFPAEAADRSIVAADVRPPANPQRALLAQIILLIRPDRRIRDCFNQPTSKRRGRNAKHQIVSCGSEGEVGLRQVTSRSIRPSRDGKQSVHAAIHRPQVHRVGKARLAYRPIRRDERWYLVRRSLVVRGGYLRIHRRTAAPQRRMRMALRATLCVIPRAQSAAGTGHCSRNRVEQRKVRLPRAEERHLISVEPGNGRAGSRRSATHPRVFRRANMLGGLRCCYRVEAHRRQRERHHEYPQPGA